MKHAYGWHFPDGENHLLSWLAKKNQIVDGRHAYQYAKLAAAVGLCTNFRCAVDIGAHIGLWSYYLAKRFDELHAFEPVAAHRECFNMNVIGTRLLHSCALGEKSGNVRIKTSLGSSGDSFIDGDGDIPMFTLDSFNLEHVDFIKIDNEGYELFVLRGAVETLSRCRPVVIVEQKPGKAKQFGLPDIGAVDYLRELGYTLAREMGGDFILTP